MSTLEPEGGDLAPRESGESVVQTDAEAVLAEAAAVVEPLEQTVDMTPLDNQRRLLLVHAHPDDETIGTGATMAKYAAEGAAVTLITCTLGEEGEILVPELAHLAADRDDDLGQHRIGELAAAMEALRVSDHRWLGGPGHYRDSGMMGVPSNDRPGCFWQADVDEAALLLVGVIREQRPQVVITYDERGGYGHPDHIQAHRVAMRAVELAADPDVRTGEDEAWQVAKVYWSAIPKSVLQAGIDAMKESGQTLFEGVDSVEDLPMGTPDEIVTTCIDARDQLEAKVAAMRAYPTQIAVDGPFFALSNNVGQRAFGQEYYQLVRGTPGNSDGENGLEDDLFSGVEQ